jgi:hypothetical protein
MPTLKGTYAYITNCSDFGQNIKPTSLVFVSNSLINADSNEMERVQKKCSALCYNRVLKNQFMQLYFGQLKIAHFIREAALFWDIVYNERL